MQIFTVEKLELEEWLTSKFFFCHHDHISINIIVLDVLVISRTPRKTKTH